MLYGMAWFPFTRLMDVVSVAMSCRSYYARGSLFGSPPFFMNLLLEGVGYSRRPRHCAKTPVLSLFFFVAKRTDNTSSFPSPPLFLTRGSNSCRFSFPFFWPFSVLVYLVPRPLGRLRSRPSFFLFFFVGVRRRREPGFFFPPPRHPLFFPLPCPPTSGPRFPFFAR